MKHQTFYSSKDKNKKNYVSSAAILLGFLSVKNCIYGHVSHLAEIFSVCR